MSIQRASCNSTFRLKDQMPTAGREIQLARFPAGAVTPSHFRVVEVATRDPRPGEVLVRNAWTSVDPGMRLRMAPRGPDGYFGAFALNRALDGIMSVGVVVESQAAGFETGDTVWHALGWRDYAVVDAAAPALGGLGTLTKLDIDLAPAPAYLGPLGGMGLTAY